MLLLAPLPGFTPAMFMALIFAKKKPDWLSLVLLSLYLVVGCRCPVLRAISGLPPWS